MKISFARSLPGLLAGLCLAGRGRARPDEARVAGAELSRPSRPRTFIG